jgi:predicted RNase H-like HicB family nuclease
MKLSVLIEQDEDGVFVASVPALPGCHTQGATLVEVEERIREAISLCLDVLRERGESPESRTFVGAHLVEVA